MLDHENNEVHDAWGRDVLLRLRKHTMADGSVPERAVLECSGLMRIITGRGGTREEFRIELVERESQEQIRKTFGLDTEWVTANQVAKVEHISKRQAHRELRSWAVTLFRYPDKIRIVKGEIRFGREFVRAHLTPGENLKLDELLAARRVN